MSGLSQQNTESAVTARSKTRGRITAPAMQNIHTLQQIHMEKVLAVQHQLAEGTYDIDRRLNVVFDRFLEDLTLSTAWIMPVKDLIWLLR
jgi:hypothetical protein